MWQVCSYTLNWAVTRLCWFGDVWVHELVLLFECLFPIRTTGKWSWWILPLFQSQQKSSFLLLNTCPENVAESSISMRLNSVSTFIWSDCPCENIAFALGIHIEFTQSYSLMNLKQGRHGGNSVCQIGSLLNILYEEWHLWARVPTLDHPNGMVQEAGKSMVQNVILLLSLHSGKRMPPAFLNATGFMKDPFGFFFYLADFCGR